MSCSASNSVKSQLKEIETKLRDIDRKIAELKDEKQLLLAQKESLQDQSMLEQSKKRALENWSGTDFPWSKKLNQVMSSVFKINELRPLQLETINATMSKQGKVKAFQKPLFTHTRLGWLSFCR